MRAWEIAEKMGVRPHDVIAFVGAGGKTSCMLELAEHCAKMGEKVLVTTTTHMEHPDVLYMAGAVDQEVYEIEKTMENCGIVIVGRTAEQPEKIQGLSEKTLEYLIEKSEKVLIEADGSKRLPMKIPNENEPVIPKQTTHIFIMAGARSLGKSLDDVCFRLEKAKKILGIEEGKQTVCETKLTVKMMGKLLKKGYVETLKKQYPDKKIAVILNQTDVLEEFETVRRELETMLKVPVFTRRWTKAVHMIVLAAGFSKRFGENKLLYKINGIPMYQHLVKRLSKLKEEKYADSLVVVSQYEIILREVQKQGISVMKNEDSTRGISSSLKLGILKTQEIQKENKEDYYMFFAADQPWIRTETIKEFLSVFFKSGRDIGCISYQGEPCNPVIFHKKYLSELMELTGDVGGKRVLRKHMEEVLLFEVEDEREVTDCDYKEDLV